MTQKKKYYVPQLVLQHVEYIGARIPIADTSIGLTGFMPVFNSLEAAKKYYPDGEIAIIEVKDSSTPGEQTRQNP